MKSNLKNILPRVTRKLKLAGRLNQTTSIRSNGHSFKIPLLGHVGYGNLNLTEPWMSTLLSELRPLIDTTRTFVDVGANIGQSLLKLRSLFPDMPYVGFEPNPQCVVYLQELCKANGFRHIRLYPVGLGNAAALPELEFYGGSEEDASASLMPGFRPDERVYRSIPVPVFPAHAVDFRAAIEIIKIDVEGGECEVIQSFEEILGSDRPLVLMEILPVYRRENKERLERQQCIESLMKELDYHCFRIVTRDGELDHLTPVEAIGIHSDLSLCEYVWVPGCRVSEFEQCTTVRTAS